MAKQVIRELCLLLQRSTRTMQQLAVDVETQISMVFGTVPAHVEDETVIKISVETNSLVQGWQ